MAEKEPTNVVAINSTKELPLNVEMLEFGPPYYADRKLQEVVETFQKKFGKQPSKIYQLGENRFWALIEEEIK